jgi:hypothetical protein
MLFKYLRIWEKTAIKCHLQSEFLGEAWQCTPVFSAPERLRQRILSGRPD